MKKLQLVERLSKLLFLFFAIISCKKEPDVDKNIDLTDANIRITKVEVKQSNLNPPLISQTNYIIYYEYSADKTEVKATIPGWTDKSKIFEIYYNENNLFVKYNWIRLTRFEPSREEKFLLYYGDITNEGNYIFNPYTSLFNINEGKIKSINDTFNASIAPFVGYIWPSQFGETTINYTGNLVSSISEFYQHEEVNKHLTVGDGLKMSNIVWNGQYISSYNIKNTLNKYFPNELLYPELSISEDSNELILNSPSIGTDFNVTLSYQATSGLPLELIRFVNQALGDLLPTAISDYLITHNSLFDRNSFFWRKHGDAFYQPLSIFNNDWMLTFADKRLSIIPEQSKIISGKRVQGQYLSNIKDKNPIYKTIDSSATYPYTHDPVAKTLEIAGLKIWYEVIE